MRTYTKAYSPLVLGAVALFMAGSGTPADAAPPVVSTFAGVPAGANDAPSSFQRPTSLAVDGAGNVYLADTGNQVIWKVTPAGVASALAGTPGQQGSADGPGSSALFNGPNGLAVDALGNLYVADSGNSTIRKITPAGVVSTLAGTAGQLGCADGAGPAASFWWPFGVAVDGSGTVYVSDTSNACIRKITPGGVVSTLAGAANQPGCVDAVGSAARFDCPHAIAVDGLGNLYVADSLNNLIRKITPAGAVSTVAGTTYRGDNDGVGASFFDPTGLALDGSGNLYVADPLNETIRTITPQGIVSTLAGQARNPGNADGPAATATFFHPSGVAVDGAGNVYVADTLNGTIRKIAF